MTIRARGLLLLGDDSDVTALAALSDVTKDALTRTYTVAHTSGAVAVLMTDALNTTALAEAGCPIATISDAGVVDVNGKVLGAVTNTTSHDGLLAALPLRGHTVTRAPEEVLFVVDESAGPRIAAQLMLLDRGDALAATLIGDGPPRTTLRLLRPPWWLLSRVLDGDEPGVRALAAVRAIADDFTGEGGPAPLYVELGHKHPLSTTLARALAKQAETGLLWGDGVLERIAIEDEAALADVIEPVLPTVALTARGHAPADAFSIPLRLAHDGDDDSEPELFIVDAVDLPRLVTFAEAAQPDELDRVLLSRLGDDDGRPRYVVKEVVRPNMSRLGARLMSVTERDGFVQVPGVTGLFVPRGRRLSPTLKPKALRALLGLKEGNDSEGAAAVVVDEDSDGLKVTALMVLDTAPLSTLSTFILTDRRTIYDALFEDAVLHFPPVKLLRPQGVPTAPPPRVRAAEAPRTPSPKKKPIVIEVTKTPTAAPAIDDDIERWRQLEGALEKRAIAAAEDADVWTELSQVKLAIGRDDVLETAATAMFLGGTLTADELLQLRAMAAEKDISDPAEDVLALATKTQLLQAEAVRLVVSVLRLIRGEGTQAITAELLDAATTALLRESVPLPRRLQWTALKAIAVHQDDAIALTRAKEAVLGAVNAHGLSETVDVPRFVRVALAIERSMPAETRETSSERTERTAQLDQLERGLVLATQTGSAARNALLRAIFCLGFARTGGPARRMLNELAVERESHQPPVQGLLLLYEARTNFALLRASSDALTAADLQSWREDAVRILAQIERPEDRRIAEWLAKRSAWLRTEEVKDTTAGLRPPLKRVVDAAVTAHSEGKRVDFAGAVIAARKVPGCYDYETVGACERLIALALSSGRDDSIAATAREATAAAATVRIAAHRARLYGAIVRASAIIDDNSTLENCLDGVAAIAQDKSVPSVANLLLALRPAIVSLRKVGALETAQRFLSAFVPLTTSPGKETAPLSAALAQGFLQLGDADTATLLLERANERAFHQNTPHVDRYEAGAAVVQTLSSWPTVERGAMVLNYCERLTMFSDTFTTGGHYPTHQLLLAERMVDAIADDQTLRSDALQGYLDADEARLRRRIVADWRAAIA